MKYIIRAKMLFKNIFGLGIWFREIIGNKVKIYVQISLFQHYFYNIYKAIIPKWCYE